MKFVAWKNYLIGQILYRSLVPLKKTASFQISKFTFFQKKMNLSFSYSCFPNYQSLPFSFFFVRFQKKRFSKTVPITIKVLAPSRVVQSKKLVPLSRLIFQAEKWVIKIRGKNSIHREITNNKNHYSIITREKIIIIKYQLIN